MLELCDLVIIDGAQKLMFEVSVTVLIFAENTNLLIVASVCLGDKGTSSAGTVEQVGGSGTQDSEVDADINHLLVIDVPHHFMKCSSLLSPPLYCMSDALLLSWTAATLINLYDSSSFGAWQ